MAYHNGPKPVNDGLVLCLDAGNRKSQTNNRFRSYGTGLTTENVGFAINGNGTFQRVAAGTVIGGYTVQTSDVVYSYALGSDGCHYHGSTSIIPAGSYATMAVDYLVTGATNYPSNGALLVFENYGGAALGGAAYVQNNLQNVWQRLTLTSGVTAGIGTQAMFLYPGYCGGRMADSGTIYMRNPIVEWKSADSGPAGFNATSDLTQWYDLSGNGYNGTLTNGTAYSSANGGTFRFDGSDDYVALPAPSTWLPTSAITINAWVKPTAVGSAYKKIFCTVTAGTQSITGVYFSIGPSPYNTYFGLVTSNGGQSATYTQDISTTQYSNLCGTYDGVNIKLYLNGVLVATQAHTGTIGNTGIARISGYDNGNEIWDGNIGSVMVHNVALNASQVLQNYNALRGRFGL